jgi:cytochrome c oxidase assembly protein subunit 15
MNADRWFYRLSLFATALTFVVVVLGAYVRLTDAGLGCPDWPGCYGQLLVPDTRVEISQANVAYPERPVEVGKGWKEMIHRYVAGTLGLTLFALAVMAVARRRVPGQPVALPLAIAALVVFQSALGMWTVTWKLKPVVVMAHLLGGLTILSLLWWQTLKMRERVRGLPFAPLPRLAGLRSALIAALVLLVAQIALGGWTSTNYAAVACNEFPTCTLGQYWPERADFAEGFTLWHGIGPNYEFGVHLSNAAKIAIHLTHRVGAVVVTLVLLALAWGLWRAVPGRTASGAAAVLILALGLQLLLGIGNVVLNLPLAVAVAHNAGAALLLLVLVTLNFLGHPARSP